MDALIQQGYPFVLGVLYAYWLEKSQRIVAPILAHDLSDGITPVVWALGIFQHCATPAGSAPRAMAWLEAKSHVSI
ncbi:MAG: hypothetical protein ACP5P4_15310 [Steroidobacteraceae bacterium]